MPPRLPLARLHPDGKRFQSLGSVNHLTIFGTDKLELIGVPGPNSLRQDIIAFPPGLNGLVFGTEDSSTLHLALMEAAVAASPPKQFSRPFLSPAGPRDAVFRTVHLEAQPVWPGRIYFCHHFTRDVVWQDASRHYANGSVGVIRPLIASDHPSWLGSTFGRAAVRSVPEGDSLVVGLCWVDVLDHAAVSACLGDAAVGADARAELMQH